MTDQLEMFTSPPVDEPPFSPFERPETDPCDERFCLACWLGLDSEGDAWRHPCLRDRRPR